MNPIKIKYLNLLVGIFLIDVVVLSIMAKNILIGVLASFVQFSNILNIEIMIKFPKNNMSIIYILSTATLIMAMIPFVSKINNSIIVLGASFFVLHLILNYIIALSAI